MITSMDFSVFKSANSAVNAAMLLQEPLDKHIKRSMPYELFDCDYTPYKLNAIQLRYPEFFRKEMAQLI